MHIVVSPLSQLAAVRIKHRPSDVLSLLSPDSEPPDLSDIAEPHRRLLRFHDVNAPHEAYIAPDPSHIEDILAFSRSCSGRDPLLVHCFAGISRSTAAAYIIACDRAGAGSERILARRLRATTSTATPNPLMIAHADQILARDGRMIAAIEDIGRGAFAREGAPFTLWIPPPAPTPPQG
jgi:predicted protein tyrosine phosphatase